jgi:hypothetical protein
MADGTLEAAHWRGDEASEISEVERTPESYRDLAVHP